MTDQYECKLYGTSTLSDAAPKYAETVTAANSTDAAMQALGKLGLSGRSLKWAWDGVELTGRTGNSLLVVRPAAEAIT